ncbi:hypothetical protein ABZ917_17665 [Nonomuraea wenchangensis]
MDHKRMRTLLYHATNGGIVGDEAEELWALYWEMEDGEAERRRAAIKRDRQRAAALVRMYLSPHPEAELTQDAAELVEAILNGSRARRRWA